MKWRNGQRRDAPGDPGHDEAHPSQWREFEEVYGLVLPCFLPQ